jgi:hypothetical protein
VGLGTTLLTLLVIVVSFSITCNCCDKDGIKIDKYSCNRTAFSTNTTDCITSLVNLFVIPISPFAKIQLGESSWDFEQKEIR